MNIKSKKQHKNGMRNVFKLARFEKETRYYTIMLEQDLFDDWVITVINGRINTKLGKIRKLAFKNCSDAVLRFDDIAKTRIKRKYLLNSSSEREYSE